MEKRNPAEIKQRILSFLKENGPSLPSPIARHMGMEILFASAFLSELASEKKIKISNMKVGSSPIYYLEETKRDLEKFSEFLRNKEKEAFLLIKKKKFLEDNAQEPAIRIALRQLKDFAIPLEKENKLFWRYFNSSKEEFKEKESKEQKIEKTLEKKVAFPQKKREIKKPVIKRKPSQKKNEKFFNKVKEFLSKSSIEIIDIVGVSKDNLTLKVNDSGQEKILIAFNKKRILEKDILTTHKKATEAKLPYIILSLGELSKKLDAFIEAIKNLSSINKIE